MDHAQPLTAVLPETAVLQQGWHQLLACQPCLQTSQPFRFGLTLWDRWSCAIAMAQAGEAFEMSGLTALTDCKRPCAVASPSSVDTARLFADVAPPDELDAPGTCTAVNAKVEMTGAVILAHAGALQ